MATRIDGYEAVTRRLGDAATTRAVRQRGVCLREARGTLVCDPRHSRTHCDMDASCLSAFFAEGQWSEWQQWRTPANGQFRPALQIP